MLARSSEGLRRKANDDEKLLMIMNRILAPKATVLYPNSEFVCCFM
jgi:hypothetical protein